MKPRVYVETTIPSYLTAWPSRDLVRAAQQQVTREWWDQRAAFDLFISPLVLVECQAGDAIAAADRVAALAGLPLLDQTEEVAALAEAVARAVPIPTRAAADAIPIATAAVHGMQYLLTWNCTHIANAALRPRIDGMPGGGVRAPIDLHTAGTAAAGERAMTEDEVVREVRAAREAFAASYGYDIRAMVAALHELGVASGRKVVRFAPRPPVTGPNLALQQTGATAQVSGSSRFTDSAPAAER
jgi:hypothetical protein